MIPRFITRILADKPPIIYGDGHQTRDFTYIANVVHGILLAADAPEVSGMVINVANGRSTSLLQLIHILNGIFGTDVQPVHESPRSGDVRDSMADISLAQRVLKYEPQVDFETGLRRSIEYYKSVT